MEQPKHERVPETLLTSRQVAEQLGLAECTITKLRKRGKLRSLKLGKNTVRFRQSDVDEFLRGKAA
jgi:excisionase family DNA binding protein